MSYNQRYENVIPGTEEAARITRTVNAAKM
jgi:hypothetical protein